MKTKVAFCVLSLLTLFHSSIVLAWGRWGHAITGNTAALILAEEEKVSFLKFHAYDMGYYNNVPDFIWKNTNYKEEKINHFIDLEIFTRAMKGAEWPTDRLQFEEKFPSIPKDAGRSFWRVNEFDQKLAAETEILKKGQLSQQKHHEHQGRWLLLAGIMGHYIADLAMPLHCSENYDGEMTGQKGMHHFFEETMVDELVPALANEVFKKAQAKWKTFKSKHSKTSTFQLAKQLCEDSNGKVATLLATDKKVGRKDLKKATAAHREMIIDRLSEGAVHLAELWRRRLGWEYNGEKFYFFSGAPQFIQAPK